MKYMTPAVRSARLSHSNYFYFTFQDYGGQTLSVVTRASLAVGKNLTSVVDPDLSDNKYQVNLLVQL